MLGQQLKKLRVDRGLSLHDAGDLMGVRHSTIDRWEKAINPPTPEKVMMLLGRYGIRSDTPTWLALVSLARNVETVRSAPLPPPGPPPFVALADLMRTANRLRIFEPSLVPWPAQTDGYARAVIETRHQAPPEVEKRVRARLELQNEILARRREGVELHLLVSQAVLHYVVGGPRVWRQQLTRLLEVSEMRGVAMRVVPWSVGAFAAATTNCELLGFDGLPTLVYFETRGTQGFVEEPDEVRPWESDFEHLWSNAWSADQVRAYIEELLR